MDTARKSLRDIVLDALISSALVSVVVGVLFTGYVARVEGEVRSRRAWKEQSVAELLGPVNIQLDRTKRAFDRWGAQNLYLEAKVLKVGNETIRALLLDKGHLIPPELLGDAANLIEHYDVWLEIFEKKRGGSEPDLESAFIFAAPEGYGFPRESAQRFQRTYQAYWGELYGPGSSDGPARPPGADSTQPGR